MQSAAPDAPELDRRLPDAAQLLTFSIYLVAVGAGLVAIISFGGSYAPVAVPAWLAFASLGGTGHAILNRVNAVQTSVGPSNGVTIRESTQQNTQLLEQLTGLERYQHLRNHDVLNGLHRLGLGQHLILQHLGIVGPDEPPPAPPAPSSVEAG